METQEGIKTEIEGRKEKISRKKKKVRKRRNVELTIALL